MLELVMTFMGGKTRWRTMPWMVLALAVLVLPLGGVSIYFIIIQPIVIGTWCTICLIAGLAMVIMIPYSLDEFVAMGQFLVDARRKGTPFWRAFWTGDAMEGGIADPASGPGAPGAPMGDMIRQAARGVTLPWALLASCAVGLWFMFTRLSFGTSGQMANSDHLVGALVVTFCDHRLYRGGAPAAVHQHHLRPVADRGTLAVDWQRHTFRGLGRHGGWGAADRAEHPAWTDRQFLRRLGPGHVLADVRQCRQEEAR